MKGEVVSFSRAVNGPPKIQAPCPKHNVKPGRCCRKPLVPNHHHHSQHADTAMELHDTPHHWCHFWRRVDNKWVCLLHTSWMERIPECKGGQSHKIRGVWAPEWPRGSPVNLSRLKSEQEMDFYWVKPLWFWGVSATVTPQHIENSKDTHT